MTWRHDQQPGSVESLLALYDAVVSAEEVDLAEQAADDALRAEFGWLEDASDGDAEDDADSDASEPPDDERLNMSQALGIVEHLLGGRKVLHDTDPTA